MIVNTYNKFILLYDIPYTFVVSLYLLVKYAALITTLTALVVRKYRKGKQKGKHCEDNCCSDNCCSGCWKTYSSWQIRIVFGGTEGVSENKQLDTDKRRVYIRGKEVTHQNLNILGTIITCFTLLLLLIMYSTYLLEITFQCSEDPAIYCFAKPADDDDSSNLMIDQNQRITNCSYYEDLTPSSPVSINCFRYALNAKEALAVGGGLLAIFTVSMRFLISAITTIWSKLNLWSKKRGCSRLQLASQITAFVVLHGFNLSATIILVVFTYAGKMDSFESKDAPVAQQTAAYLADNGIQFVIILSTVELLLLLDWSKFEAEEEQEDNNQEDDQNNSGSNQSPADNNNNQEMLPV